MTFKRADRIRETSTTTGTGTYTLAGAPSGFQPFSVLGANNTSPYFATDGVDWESGISTVLTGPNRLERTTILASSNAGAAVNWAAGTRTLRCGQIAAFGVPRTLSKSVAGTGTTVLTQDEQRREVIEFTGALTGNRVIEVDATPWLILVYNNTSGSFTLTVKVTGQTGVAVPQGRRMMLYCDGTDVRSGAAMSANNGSEFASGTPLVFPQTTAPVGWTKSTTHNDKALRVVSGTAGSGGATGFTSVFGAGKLTGAKTLATAEIPAHTHLIVPGGQTMLGNWNGVNNDVAGGTVGSFVGTTTGSTGGGGSHDHTLSLDLAYLDVIVATKD